MQRSSGSRPTNFEVVLSILSGENPLPVSGNRYRSHAPGTFRIGAAELEYQDCSTYTRYRLAADLMLSSRTSGESMPARYSRVQSEVRLMLAARQLDQTMVAMRSKPVAAKAAWRSERTQKLLVDGAGLFRPVRSSKRSTTYGGRIGREDVDWSYMPIDQDDGRNVYYCKLTTDEL